ncbi:uncharacterized protein LOC125225134 [Leguminivora glycinivorella]|uniref:uncharacterized protein LOC125225134 n=1 Tax=Leguminivora glycinivorella TaxID=1035111 RepID=UPI00200C125D|nr:uncharacterized protein LOC125225134 [Leguminivora glycinivorella]
MEAICQLSAFISRCEDTLKNLCTQTFALFAENIINLSKIQLHYIINHIGEMFTIVVLLELLISSSSLTRNWRNYCKRLKTLQQNAETVDLPDDKFVAVLGAIDNITAKVMNDDIVLNSLNSLLGLRKTLIDRNCSMIADQFSHYLRLAIASLDKLVQDKPNVSSMNKCIKINALFVLNSHLFGNNDKKNFKALIELNTKAHSVPIVGTADD